MQGVNTGVDMENVLHAAHEVNLLPSVCSVIGWPSFFAIDAQFTRYAIMTGQVKRRGAERLRAAGRAAFGERWQAVRAPHFSEM